METPPAVPGGGAETLAAAAAEEQAKAKRARKRSRYLSSDYDTAILVDDHHTDQDDDIADSPRKGEEEDAVALLLRLQQADLAAADLLAALLRSAASPGGDTSPGPGVVDAGVLLRFFALHRASVLAADREDTSTTTDHHRSMGTAAAPAGHGLRNTCRVVVALAAEGFAGKDPTPTTTVHHHSKGTAAPAGHGPGLPNPCRALVAADDGSKGKKQDDAIAMGQAYAAPLIGPANAAAAAPEDGPNKRNKKVTFTSDGCNAAAAADCSAQPAAGSATGQAYGHHIGPAYAAPEARRKRRRKKKAAFALDAHNAAATAGSSAQPATGIANGFNSAPKRAKKKKGRSSSGQGQHPGKPVALILELAQGTAAICKPSKEDLLSTFRGFGSLIESDTDIGSRRARLVFGSSAAAEAAYSCAHTLGTFSGRRLQYLRPPPPAPKIPLMDVRKNLERMISSLTGPSSLGREGALNLAGQMLRLMAKVDKTLCAAGAPGPSTAAAAHHRH